MDNDFVAYFETIQITEDLAVNIVVPGEDQVAELTWIGRANVLTYAELQMFPIVALYDGAAKFRASI